MATSPSLHFIGRTIQWVVWRGTKTLYLHFGIQV